MVDDNKTTNNGMSTKNYIITHNNLEYLGITGLISGAFLGLTAMLYINGDLIGGTVALILMAVFGAMHLHKLAKLGIEGFT